MKILIIGAGPAGLICAYKLKENGHEVILVDKNEKVGKKIYITGKGRCNVTNNCTREEFFENIVNNGKFLYSSYSNFNSQDTIDLFEMAGVPLVTERGNRVFPTSYNAGDIAKGLYELNKSVGTNIKLNEEVISINKEDGLFLIKSNRSTYLVDRIVIATGGLSYPYTGSTGDGYLFAKKFGHSIIEPVAALSAFKIKEEIPTELYKFTFKNVVLNIKTPKFKKSEFGELTFYKEGLAGASALTLSSQINRINPEDISISIDFKPALSKEKLEARILREIADKRNKTVEDLVHKLLPKEIVSWFFDLTQIDKRLVLNTLKKEIRESIIINLKEFKLTYLGLDTIERATVTSGGINVKEIDPKTLESKLIPGLYFAGEVIDVDAFTGGFNLQIAFSTGFTVAKNIK